MDQIASLLQDFAVKPPYLHQVIGVSELVLPTNEEIGRTIPNCLALFDEMGAGKSKQVIDAAQLLCMSLKIDRAVIVCPASVRSVWFDPDLGQLHDHLWPNINNLVTEYHSKLRQWRVGPTDGPKMKWIITNYEYIRDEDHRKFLRAHLDSKTLLVLDESSAVKNWKAAQTKASLDLRKRCGRVVILNGTPTTQGPGDLYSQFNILNPKILDCKSWYNFRSRYAKLGGFMNKQIVEWLNLEDLQRRTAPYVLRRLKEDCLDLPEKLAPVSIVVPLKEETWTQYKAMRDEMVVWLNSSDASTAQQAIVKTMRLSQITSGFIGGVDSHGREVLDEIEACPDWVEEAEWPVEHLPQASLNAVKYISKEKLDAFLEWLHDKLDDEPKFKVLVWCRHRAELARLEEALLRIEGLYVGMIHGGQKRDERNAALQMLDPRTCPDGPVVVAGTPSSGSMGLNLTAAHTVVYMSNDYSLKTRLQSEDRVHRPGQRHVVSYYDMVATGPKGQRTIDHTIIGALRDKNNLAKLTASAWIRELQRSDEEPN